MVVSATTPPLAQDTLTLKAVWENLSHDSCPYHYNFHLHTHCSDGQLTPEALIKQVVDIGLKGLAITDHHSIEGYKQAQIWLENQHLNSSFPHLWTGVEITANLLETEVHILGYGFDPAHTVLTPYLQGLKPEGDLALASRVIKSLQQAGGLVVLAHPFRYHRPGKEVVAAAVELGIDGIEAYYAYGNPKPWLPSRLETEQAIALSHQYQLLTTCGTDSHGKSLLQRI
jgi:predicted metal-dependent phosphoesterase TrpH